MECLNGDFEVDGVFLTGGLDYVAVEDCVEFEDGPDLTSLLREDGELHVIVVESTPGYLVEGGEGSTDF